MYFISNEDRKNNLLINSSLKQSKRSSNLSYSQNIQHKNDQSLVGKNIQQVIQKINIYVRSAQDLKKNLQRTDNENQKKESYFLKTDTEYEQSQITFYKIDMFITSCLRQLKNIHKNIQSSSSIQIQRLGSNYNRVLQFIKQKYSQLIKQSYRILNMKSMEYDDRLTPNDRKVVIQNRKKKIKQIGFMQKEMEGAWQMAGMSQNKNEKQFNISKNKQNDKYHSKNGKDNQISSVIVTFDDQTTLKQRRFQILDLQNKNMNLRQMAKSELQKQFLAIRIQSLNIYQNYVSHSHTQTKQKMVFLKEQQQILQTQVQQQSKTSKQLKQQYERLRRQLSEIKTINQLIRKRYVLRQSIRLDSQEFEE